MLAVTSYLTWLSKGYGVGQNPSWRNRNTIATDKLIPIAALDRGRGQQIYEERCTSCHGLDGQGVQIGDKKAGPLWGPASWNDGAGSPLHECSRSPLNSLEKLNCLERWSPSWSGL